MTVLHPSSHSARLQAGDDVFTAASTVATAPIAKKLTNFKKAHDALGKADAALHVAETKLASAQERLAEADNVQDESIEPLAGELVSMGRPRTAPFKGLSQYRPSKLAVLGYAAEAKELTALAGKVRKLKGVSPGATKACKACESAAAGVTRALAPIEGLTKAVSDARTRRDALTQPWETAFSSLKRAAKVAEDDGARGLYDALFRATAPTPKKKPAAGKPAKGTSAKPATEPAAPSAK